VRTVFSESRYRARAQQWKAEIGNIEGLRLAADIVERAVQTKQPVRRP
jgi:UDP:flavonoid glycosyltransferase YjiC (YdhE family)